MAVLVNELRVGNIVNVNYLEGGIKHCVLTADLLGDLLVGDKFNINIEDCSPIEITPEILEQCGFEKDGKDEENIWLRLKEGGFTFESDESCNFKVVFISVMGRRVTEADSLHQLQNLYFALTGEELQIKQLATA